MKKSKQFLISNAVPILFTVLCIIGVYLSGTPISTILSDLVNRFDKRVVMLERGRVVSDGKGWYGGRTL